MARKQHPRTAHLAKIIDDGLKRLNINAAELCRRSEEGKDAVREIYRGHMPGQARWSAILKALELPDATVEASREISGIGSQQTLTAEQIRLVELSHSTETLPLRQQRGDGVNEPYRDDTVATIARPTLLTGRTSAYAVYVTNDDCAPFLRTGHTLYLDPTRPIAVDDWVRVSLKSSPAILGILNAQTPSTIGIRTPHGLSEYPASDISSVDLIIGSVFLKM